MSEDAPELRELFTEAVRIWLDVSNGSEYAQIWPLLQRGVELHPDEALTAGTHFLKATKVENRAVAVDMLGELAANQPEHRSTIATELLALLDTEVDVDVQWSLLSALGKTGEPSATPALVEWTAESDVAELRMQAVRSLGDIQSNGSHTTEGVDALMAATADPDDRVRSWATLALGSLIESDSDEIREVLRRRLFDTDDSTRLEAIVGLARRHDSRGFEAVKHALSDQIVPRRIFDAAALLGDPALLPHLNRANRQHIPDDAYEQVLAACQPRP